MKQRTLLQRMWPIALAGLIAVGGGVAYSVNNYFNEMTHDPTELIQQGYKIRTEEDILTGFNDLDNEVTFEDIIRYIEMTPIPVESTEVAEQPLVTPTPTLIQTPMPTPDIEPIVLGPYCDPTFSLRLAGETIHLEDFGSADEYVPLGGWELFMFSRMTPLTGVLDRVATSYDIPPDYLLRVFFHESGMNPLAVGPTHDYGLGQVTPGAEALLTALATIKGTPYYNPQLMEEYSIWDPDWNACASGLKLRWAMNQEGVDSEYEAYALYMNPEIGLNADRELEYPYTEFTARLDRQINVVERITNLFAAYAENPEIVTEHERRFVEFAIYVRDNDVDTETAYLQAYRLVQQSGSDDSWMYRRVLEQIYDVTDY